MQDVEKQRRWRWPVSPVVMLVVLLAGLVVIGAGLTLVATDNDEPLTKADETPTSKVALAVDASKPGARLADDTFGLSFEANALTQPEFDRGNLARYMRTLGPGVIRIGGNSSDRMFWTSSGEDAPPWAQGTLTPVELDRLARVAEESDWTVILGVNLKQFDPGRAADEVAHAQRRLGKRLRAVVVGNEPNVYYEDSSRFFDDFTKYVTEIRKAVPSAQFIGPAASETATSGRFVADFVVRQAARQTADVVALSQHTYPQTSCNDRKTDISSLLKSSTYTSEKKIANDTIEAAAKLGVPAVIDETNSVSCGGQKGVSDVYAASLWALGHGLAQAAEGVSGIYFHGSATRCGATPPYNDYTPLCAPSKSDAKKGRYEARPLYYGLLALGRLREGQFVAVSNPSWQSVHAFAVKHADGMSIVLINVTSPATNGATAVEATVKGEYKSAKSYLLNNEERELDSKDGITLGGNEVKRDGTFEEPPATSVAFDGANLRIVLPAGSASVISLS